MIDKVYLKSRLGSKLNKLAGKAGLNVYHIVIGNEPGTDVHLQVSIPLGSPRVGLLNKDEEAARRLLALQPELRLEVGDRNGGLGLIHLCGETGGITWAFYTGSGSASKILEAL